MLKKIEPLGIVLDEQLKCWSSYQTGNTTIVEKKPVLAVSVIIKKNTNQRWAKLDAVDEVPSL